jgi:DNA-directed RNA polymerase subunit RPC12/RpoP
MTRRGYTSKRGLILKCSKCKKSYDIVELASKAESKNRQNLYCPYCGNPIGTLQ